MNSSNSGHELASSSAILAFHIKNTIKVTETCWFSTFQLVSRILAIHIVLMSSMDWIVQICSGEGRKYFGKHLFSTTACIFLFSKNINFNIASKVIPVESDSKERSYFEITWHEMLALIGRFLRAALIIFHLWQTLSTYFIAWILSPL